MSDLWERLRDSRALRPLLVYAAASWPILEFTAFVREEFQLPRWLVAAMIGLLFLGAVVLAATAWVQSRPGMKLRASAQEVPESWEVDLADVGASVAGGRFPHLTWARVLLGGALAVALLFGIAGLVVLLRDRDPGLGASEALAGEAGPGLAVLPFSVSGAGTEDLREGMVDLLSTNLDGVTGLRSIDSRTVLSRWGDAVPGAADADLSTALDVARRAGARYALLGKAVAVGRQVRLIAEVYDVRDGTKLGQDQVEGSPDEILTLVDRLSVEVLRQILSAEDAHVELGQLPDVDLARVTTGSLPALKAFLQGEALIRRSRFGEATERFRAAVEADSTFALAWYRLGTSRGWLEGLDEDHVANFRRAAELSARLPERERMLLAAALALARNDATAIDLAERAVEEYPDDPEAWYLLGDAQFHLGFIRLAARDASADAFRKALELDPNFAPAYIHLLQIAMIHETDSAATTRLLRLYHGVAAESEYDVAARVAYDFVFGDADTADARAAADTIGQAVMQPLMFFLGHPAGLRAQGVLLHEIRELPHPAAQIGGTIGLAWNSLARGRLRELQDVLDDPRLPPDERQDVLLQAALADFPLPPATFESALALTAVDTTSAEDLLEAGAYAALKGQPEDDRRAREALERLGNRASASGDTAAAASVSAMSRTLEGVELMQAGRFAEATELLEQTRRGLGGNEDRVGLAVGLTYVIGDGLLRAGQPAEALPYLLAFPFPTPLLYLRLGQAYEAEARFDEAREAYQLFVLGWRDADPELQPRLREAQAAIRRLSSVIQE